MKKILIIVMSVVWAFNLSAQTIVRQLPSWVTVMPKTPRRANFYYRVTCAEAPTYQEAYSKAFATAILESSWKLGVAVDVNMDMKSLEQSISNSIDVINRQIRIPLNKVCEYSEEASTSMNIRVYVLWQVAQTGNSDPGFTEFCNCR